MEMDELIQRLHNMRDKWFSGTPYKSTEWFEGISRGKEICGLEMSDLLELVRQTKKG